MSVCLMLYLKMFISLYYYSNNPAKGSVSALLLLVCIVGMVPFAFWSMCFFKGTDHLAHCKDHVDMFGPRVLN